MLSPLWRTIRATSRYDWAPITSGAAPWIVSLHELRADKRVFIIKRWEKLNFKHQRTDTTWRSTTLAEKTSTLSNI
jgi:hypothetical protein